MNEASSSKWQEVSDAAITIRNDWMLPQPHRL